MKKFNFIFLVAVLFGCNQDNVELVQPETSLSQPIAANTDIGLRDVIRQAHYVLTSESFHILEDGKLIIDNERLFESAVVLPMIEELGFSREFIISSLHESGINSENMLTYEPEDRLPEIEKEFIQELETALTWKEDPSYVSYVESISAKYQCNENGSCEFHSIYIK